MNISIIIPTLNAEKHLPELLNRLSSQTIADKMVHIIDSESDDNTRYIARSFGIKAQVIPRREFNHGGTRNIAAALASGDYLVFLTQDALPVNDTMLENLVKPMDQDERIAVTYGRQIAYDNAYVIEKFIRGFNYPAESRARDKSDIESLGVKTFFCSNACSAYRRQAFLQLGGFRNDTIMNEDMDFVYRAVMAGYKVHYAADAQVWHSHNYTLLEQFRRHVDIGVFFSKNRHLADCSRNEKEGKRYLLNAAGYLLQNKKIFCLVHLFLDGTARFLGYRVGSSHRFFSRRSMRSLSMHKNYWL